MVTEHNTNLATEIAEMLGHIQHQDVVRQRIERVASAMMRRNDLLKEMLRGPGESPADLTNLPGKMQVVLNEYLANEARHTRRRQPVWRDRQAACPSSNCFNAHVLDMTIAPDVKTILIVEDAPEYIEILVTCLRDEYAIKVAQDGESALDLANREERTERVVKE